MKVSITNSLPTYGNSEQSLNVQTQQNHQSEPNILADQRTEVTKQKLETAVENLNDFIEPVITNLKFVLHEDLHEYYVTIVNPLTDEVIREIPPKKLLDMYAAMAEYIGLLVDEKI